MNVFFVPAGRATCICAGSIRWHIPSGSRPWELMAELPIHEQIGALFDREEAERHPPFGPALDIGCGTGIWSVELASRGWQVTGSILFRVALRKAGARVREAGVNVRLVHGDITALDAVSVGLASSSY